MLKVVDVLITVIVVIGQGFRVLVVSGVIVLVSSILVDEFHDNYTLHLLGGCTVLSMYEYT